MRTRSVRLIDGFVALLDYIGATRIRVPPDDDAPIYIYIARATQLMRFPIDTRTRSRELDSHFDDERVCNSKAPSISLKC